MIIMRQIQNRIEKKGHGFIVNVMVNNEYYRFCQPSFLYSYFKTCHDRQEGSKLTSDKSGGVYVLGGICPRG